jgi:hypothetical protein
MIKIIATLCSLSAPDNCHDRVVTTSNFAEISIASCQSGAAQIAAWMRDYPQYRLAGWRCEIGSRQKITA